MRDLGDMSSDGRMERQTDGHNSDSMPPPPDFFSGSIIIPIIYHAEKKCAKISTIRDEKLLKKLRQKISCTLYGQMQGYTQEVSIQFKQ
jgi:hypothetical protein